MWTFLVHGKFYNNNVIKFKYSNIIQCHILSEATLFFTQTSFINAGRTIK